MKLYMVNYENSSLLAVSNTKGKYIIPALVEECPNYFKSIENFLNYEEHDNNDLDNFIKKSNLKEISITDNNVLAPILDLRQNIMCMGLNYEDHIKESGKAFSRDIKKPKFPIIFTKSALSINSPF